MEQLEKILNNELLNENKNKIKEILYEVILHHINDAVFIMKVEHGECERFKYLFVNEIGLKQAGLSSESIGSYMDEVIGDHEASITLQSKYKKILKNSKGTSYYDRIELPNGKSIVNQSILTPIHNEETGEIEFVVAISRDMTATFDEKNMLLESEQRYRSIIDHNLDAILSLDDKGRIINANSASKSMMGYCEKELVQRSIFNLVPDEELASISHMLKEALSGNAKEMSICSIIHKKGNELLVQLKSIPIVVNDSIIGIYVIIRDMTEHSRNTETIKYMAFHDQLTGLWNRRALLEHLQDEIPKAQAERVEMALLYIDLDRFKYFNDTLGHKTGDEILKKIADRLMNLSLMRYRIYRLGGDEFVVVLLQAHRSCAEKAAQKILAVFSEPVYLMEEEYFITPSIGISMFPSDGKDTESLIKSADSALFQVKQKGKAHYRFYNADMNVAFPNYILMESHLRRAIEKNELIIYYQPQVNLITGKMDSFEALLRWQNPVFGFVAPSQFIPLAEDTGLIIPIGEWVIENVCKQIASWREKGHQNIRIAINISPKQFLQHKLPEFIKNALIKYDLPPNVLEIEITEGAMQDTRMTLMMLNRLKEIGVVISVDDFGTGYSSLNYLKRFPLDILKIDQSFVKEIKMNSKDAAITKTIIHLAHSLGLEVIAEGVEDFSQVEFLLDAKCQKAQGFYFSKPVSPNEIETNLLVANM
ncbi:bifunctional diguanylate cyclase/phosphodiesterase [Falsibacillus pallidus]|uniref:Diguanylate cyclase/phosphodiesterase with PAS/PAC sensor(S) n=1 Tax=Falsibacillus pallidus TaxID=493781 RepID=A0A370GVE3_9BACI|nr:bifunctional diguanylate cyclase/phosphodiesterase [Falsibacillus pallidus]RDI47648.1 diguanylate cyclase/phosphodiesterase with PAS/PAC sensor(s) [Falsibacillus pallidus]